ncbi:MAG: tRNA (guanosine(46)-N7)-methyltransferase TrmB, partial [Candidatus Cloacimonetes bacterium]|nr:tRNA (guanosine(46)-N7)-methyltransferase TrmB [Candidatus Cloacimonadota bacterium]
MKEDLSLKRDFFLINRIADKDLDFTRIFGNVNPVYLEIGSGRGEFIVAKSRQNLQINFLGIDVKDKRIKTILRKLDLQENSNVRLLRLFVDQNLERIIPAASLERIYILHPDPWPKRKHHKNRLIQDLFLDVLSRLLIPSGDIMISTDHREYAWWIKGIFAGREDFCLES